MISDLYLGEKCSLRIDTSKKILIMSTCSDSYNKEVFLKFIEYFTGFWKLVKTSKEKYHVLLDLSEDKTAWMPIEFYTTLITSLNSISSILNENMHSMCILINKTGLTGSIIKMVLKLYSPDRPVTYTTDYNEAQSFFESNKLDL
jgi:hypothetical protein